MFRVIVFILTGMFFLLPNANAAPLRACLKTDTGKIVVRRRCKTNKGFQQLNAELLQGLGATQVGPKGDKGDKGDTGAQGPAGVTGHEDHSNVYSAIALPAGSAGTINEDCPVDMAVVSYRCLSSNPNFFVTSGSAIKAGGGGVVCSFRNVAATTEEADITISMICGPLM